MVGSWSEGLKLSCDVESLKPPIRGFKRINPVSDLSDCEHKGVFGPSKNLIHEHWIILTESFERTWSYQNGKKVWTLRRKTIKSPPSYISSLVPKIPHWRLGGCSLDWRRAIHRGPGSRLDALTERPEPWTLRNRNISYGPLRMFIFQTLDYTTRPGTLMTPKTTKSIFQSSRTDFPVPVLLPSGTPSYSGHLGSSRPSCTVFSGNTPGKRRQSNLLNRVDHHPYRYVVHVLTTLPGIKEYKVS